jgi:hypothetical protein
MDNPVGRKRVERSIMAMRSLFQMRSLGCFADIAELVERTGEVGIVSGRAHMILTGEFDGKARRKSWVSSILGHDRQRP